VVSKSAARKLSEFQRKHTTTRRHSLVTLPNGIQVLVHKEQTQFALPKTLQRPTKRVTRYKAEGVSYRTASEAIGTALRSKYNPLATARTEGIKVRKFGTRRKP
jgi:hypothetical protein